MLKKVVKVGPKVSEKDLQVVEETIKTKIPNQLRDHVLYYNGGQPIPNSISVEDERFEIHEFIEFKSKNGSALVDCMRNLHMQDTPFFPEHLLPFARDPGGDYFCISLRKKDLGSIWKFNMDYYDNPKRNVTRLFSSFNEFLEAFV
ncbi:MAG: SMI1/KNR4 family protein [Pirellulales bacterium]